MKAVILAGGLGTRISEETDVKPKPMIEIGGKPIIWHIMKIYSSYGIKDFIICLGYKGYVIKEYFANYYLHMSDITIDIKNNTISNHNNSAEDWKITLVDTGDHTMTGGRLKRLKPYLENEKNFCMTYGDGVANVNIAQLIEFHKKHKKLATLTTVSPIERFGILDIDQNNIVKSFKEKSAAIKTHINGGFFVLSPKVLDYIENDQTSFEQQPLEKLAKDNELAAFHHEDFWQCMDTMRDKTYLNELWDNNNPPWKTWK